MWSISCSICASLAWKPARISRAAVSSTAPASSISSCAFSGLWHKHPRSVRASRRRRGHRECRAPLRLRKQLRARVVPRGEVRRRDRHGGAREIPHLTTRAQQTRVGASRFEGQHAGRAGAAAYICDSTCVFTSATRRSKKELSVRRGCAESTRAVRYFYGRARRHNSRRMLSYNL